MSQPRIRKAPGGDLARNRTSPVKASDDIFEHRMAPMCKGDTVPTNRPREEKQRSRSKNKIPKSVRYELENALVGLCDVWFEDIKPHLVRNNIKLHVEGNAPAGGDHRCLPPGDPACSHLDPASRAVECELCRLLFNAANSIESAVSQASAASSTGHASSASLGTPNTFDTPQFDIAGTASPPSTTNKNKARKSKRPRPHRSFRMPSPPALSRRVPRLCRTNSILSATSCSHRYLNDLPTYSLPRRAKAQTHNKSTQTELRHPMQHYHNLKPLTKSHPQECNTVIAPPKLRLQLNKTSLKRNSKHSLRPTQNKLVFGEEKPTSMENRPKHFTTLVSVQMSLKSSSKTISIQNRSIKQKIKCMPSQTPLVPPLVKTRTSSSQTKVVYSQRRSVPMKAGVPSYGIRRPVLSCDRSRSRKCPTKQGHDIQLFDDDLIEIIGQKNDSRVKVLYETPTKEVTCSSIMNLFPYSKKKQAKGGITKFQPWK